MSAQAGRDALIKIGDGGGPETFTSIGGMRIKRTRFGQTLVDSTDQDSTGRWRELLASASKKFVRLEGEGVFKDTASEEAVRTAFFGDTLTNFQFVFPDWGTIQGAFLVARLDTDSDAELELRYRMVFESGGAITWTGA